VTAHARPDLADRAEWLGRMAETVLLTLLLTAMVLLAAGQIVLRNVGGTGFSWADEALRILVLWVTMVGSVAASRDQRHVRIDALSRYLPAALGRWTATLIDLFAAAVCAVLAWCSYEFVTDSFAAGDRVLGGQLPAWTVQLILPVGFGLIAYRFAVSCLRAPVRPSQMDIH
jgi:TRAP-type C4-dicarboxylate transport system permease small subunit